MNIRAALVASAVLTGWLSCQPAQARVVEYLDDMTAIQAAAQDQGIEGPFSNKPGPGPARIVLETPQAADHRVAVVSVYCQAYHIENPVSSLLDLLVRSANAGESDGAAKPALMLRLISGSTVLRCLGKGDLQMICKNRVRLAAEASFPRPDGSRAVVPITAQVEREGRVGGFCGNIARYTGIVTREAGIDLILQARAAYVQATQPAGADAQ